MLNKEIIGFLFVYVIILYIIPVLLYRYVPFTRFITYLANVDLIANVLATNQPEYFKHAYNTDSESITGYISYNIITLIALSGIFLYGLQLKLIGYSNSSTFKSMIAVSIITFTLPTMLIPYLTNYFKKLSHYVALHYIDGEHKTNDEKKDEKKLTNNTIKHISIVISSLIALGFIFMEGYIIENVIHKHDFTAKGRRVFGTRYKNPLESLFK
tara:strand:- start:431 stop:1069 length:639 start_codon:yes stop_codon:yes gene_type:complete